MDIRYQYHTLVISLEYLANERQIKVNGNISESNPELTNIFNVLNSVLEKNQRVIKIDNQTFTSPNYCEKLTAIVETRIYLK